MALASPTTGERLPTVAIRPTCATVPAVQPRFAPRQGSYADTVLAIVALPAWSAAAGPERLGERPGPAIDRIEVTW